MASPSWIDEVIAAIPTQVTEDMNESLNRCFTREEVTVALKQIHPTKAPSPDGNDGFMAAKLDMSKAFDRVKWGFIQGVMEKLGFSSRQGDSLSSILFLICIEGLSAPIHEATQNQFLTSISICRGCPRVTHLLFANVSILFCKASVGESRELKFLLQKYEDALGQKINTDKSSIFFSPNTALEVKEEIFATLSPMQDSRHSKYLGLPSFIGRSKMQVFSILKERIGHKLVGWKGLCDDIESMVRNFWWGQRQQEPKMNWVSWKTMCMPKAQGGMGFRNLQAFNKVMLAKQLWRILQNPNSLVARVLKAKYFPTKDILNANLGSSPSYSWRSIHSSLDVIRKGTR
ncbi:uncharacterized protein LOC126703770 [Quercus robur]|uniref:uncharacterized protein LOC126703770 n=1 Tax=Quercus robur TaxID=38942 RepID=UPI00216132BA|nr:uncharacterized protein LOC126703770 [Quercus robur]